MAVAILYFGIHLTFFAIDQHQKAVERQERHPIELRRGTK
jgi:hypothetical protein